MDVRLDGRHCEEEPFGNLLIGSAFGDDGKNLLFAGGQLLE